MPRRRIEMPRSSYLLEHGSSNEGNDPVTICIRATGNTPMEAVQTMRDRATELKDGGTEEAE